MSTVDLDSMSYQDVVNHLSGRKDGEPPSYVRASDQTEAERQASFETQRYARQRYRDIWVPRRDALRAIFQHRVASMSVMFNTATNLTAFAFNSRNPMALVSNAFKLAMNTFSEINGHIRRGRHIREDAIGMQAVIWNHVYDDVLPILLKRPIKDDGTVMEIPEVRGQLIGIMNDEYVLKRSPDGKREVNHDTRRKIARLLDCDYHEATGKLVRNEDAYKYDDTGKLVKNENPFNNEDTRIPGPRHRVLPVPLEPKAPVAEAPAPAAPAPRAPAMAMAPA